MRPILASQVSSSLVSLCELYSYMTRIADASFVETSSGPAARELKRQFDLLVGVGPARRSPFAITAFVNQHGKQMFRVGYALSVPLRPAAHPVPATGISIPPPTTPTTLMPQMPPPHIDAPV